MTDDFKEGVLHPAFRDVDEAVQAGEAVLASIVTYNRRLGTSALAASASDVLLPIAEQISETAQRIVERVEDLEVKEKFGDTESYWNVFRFFCIDENQGNVRTIGDVWDHLALSFDMSDESLDTLAETLLEWKDDIESDAVARFRSVGTFEEIGNGFVFYENLIVAEKKPSVRKSPSMRPVQTVPRRDTEVIAEQLVTMDALIMEAIAALGGVGKQAQIVKHITDAEKGIDKEAVLNRIDQLAADGRIHKFKPSKDRAAFLALDVDRVHVEQATEIPESQEKVAEVDVELAETVLKIITTRYRKPGQMMATSQMINRITFPDRTISIRQLNAIARLLEARGLAFTDTGSPLTGKQSKSRSRSRSVFRVGIPSTETMQQVRGILADGTLAERITTSEE